MKNRNKTIITICLIGIIVSLLALLVLKILEINPKDSNESQINFAYNYLVKKYKSDKKASLVTDGKYSSISLFKDGRELSIIGEFNIENDNLVHMCVSDGSKKVDVKNENINKEYLKENAEFERSIEPCELDK